MANDAVLIVLLFSSLAAALAAVGTLPFCCRDEVPLSWVGWAYALASGLMLGAGYILMVEELGQSAMPVVVGAGLGVGYTYWTHVYSGTGELEIDPEDQPGAVDSVKFILQSAMHSASEGLAIGVAMVVNLRLGIFMALALAVHNVAEAMVLTDVLRKRNHTLGDAAGMAIVTNVPQVLLAIVAFAVIPAVAGFLPWAVGFAAGALVYLVITELLPSAYDRAGRTGIAFVVSFATGGVVLLKGFFV